MSKYSLKLEQLVPTSQFGDVLVTIQYDGFGPKLVTLLSENLSTQTKELSETMLGMVNFMLAKNIVPKEITNLLSAQVQHKDDSEINVILSIVAGSLDEAPVSILNLDPNILVPISVDSTKEYVQNLETNEPVSEVTIDG